MNEWIFISPTLMRRVCRLSKKLDVDNLGRSTFTFIEVCSCVNEFVRCIFNARSDFLVKLNEWHINAYIKLL